MKEEQTRTEPYIAPEIAKGLEQVQIGKYHTKGGHGFAAEDANTVADWIRLKQVEVTGTSYEANGADRIVDGIPLQTKYYQTPASTRNAAFDVRDRRLSLQRSGLRSPERPV